MENIDFKELIEQPLRANDRRMINAESCAEQEFYRSNNITLNACISRTIRLCLQYPEQAMQYVESRFPSDCPYYVQLVGNIFNGLKSHETRR